jgi:hypothetical protein
VGLNLTNFAFAMKEMYPDDVLKDMTFENNPWLAMCEKDEDVEGDTIPVPVIYGNPQGRSASLSTAITNKGNTKGASFALTTAEDYSVASIARKAILASRGDAGAFARAAEVEVDGAINTCVRSLAKALYGDGNGQLGQIASVTSADPMVITLSDINDISNFEVGMVLTSDDTADGSSLRATPATATIAGIDRDLGTITTGFDNSGPTTDWAANDYLFQQGDGGAMLKGNGAWVPTTAPASTAFFGVDRTSDVTRLGGVRLTGTGMDVTKALLKLASKITRENGTPDCAFVNDVQYHEAIVELGAKVEYVKQGMSAEVYFSGIIIHGPRGPIEVYPDYNCPSNLAYVLQKNTWTLYSYDKAPHIFDLDNDQEFLRETTADSYEVRVGYYAQLGCKAPGWNGVATLDAATF